MDSVLVGENHRRSEPFASKGRHRRLALTATPLSPDDTSLTHWLVTQALPIWSTVGVDRAAGGFFEKIDLEGRAVEESRRARVVARQIYVFATAERRGWLEGADAVVDHGLRFLLERMRLADGTIAASVAPDGSVVDGEFDLYEHAFVLFALAAASRDRPARSRLRAEAEALLRCMRTGWSHPAGGFEEARPRRLPLRSNPHMHLLEAALAWAEISGDEAGAVWRTLAAELVDLCLTRFIGADGALHEYFDGDWRPMPGAAGCAVEPGHQFEWGWLLLRWGDLADSAAARQAGQRLVDIGETHGVDPIRGVAVNLLDGDFAIVDPAAKLWPQTERIKAWQAAHRAGSPAQQAEAPQRLAAAVRGLSLYLLDSPRGLWHEQLGVDGRFDLQPCRASSLYHIVCAIDLLADRQGTHPPADSL